MRAASNVERAVNYPRYLVIFVAIHDVRR